MLETAYLVLVLEALDLRAKIGLGMVGAWKRVAALRYAVAVVFGLILGEHGDVTVRRSPAVRIALAAVVLAAGMHLGI